VGKHKNKFIAQQSVSHPTFIYFENYFWKPKYRNNREMFSHSVVLSSNALVQVLSGW